MQRCICLFINCGYVTNLWQLAATIKPLQKKRVQSGDDI